MSKQETRNETISEVIELISKRSDILISTARGSKDPDHARELAHGAWELQMVLQDIERNLRS